MPLELLVLLVGVGLLLVFAAVHFLGGNARTSNLDQQTAADRMRLDYPDFQDQHLIHDSMGRGLILLQGREDPAGLVWSFGCRHVTRLLNKDTLRSHTIDGPQLTLHLNDWTLRKVTLLIDDESDLASISLSLDAAVRQEDRN